MADQETSQISQSVSDQESDGSESGVLRRRLELINLANELKQDEAEQAAAQLARIEAVRQAVAELITANEKLHNDNKQALGQQSQQVQQQLADKIYEVGQSLADNISELAQALIEDTELQQLRSEVNAIQQWQSTWQEKLADMHKAELSRVLEELSVARKATTDANERGQAAYNAARQDEDKARAAHQQCLSELQSRHQEELADKNKELLQLRQDEEAARKAALNDERSGQAQILEQLQQSQQQCLADRDQELQRLRNDADSTIERLQAAVERSDAREQQLLQQLADKEAELRQVRADKDSELRLAGEAAEDAKTRHDLFVDKVERRHKEQLGSKNEELQFVRSTLGHQLDSRMNELQAFRESVAADLTRRDQEIEALRGDYRDAAQSMQQRSVEQAERLNEPNEYDKESFGLHNTRRISAYTYRLLKPIQDVLVLFIIRAENCLFPMLTCRSMPVKR